MYILYYKSVGCHKIILWVCVEPSAIHGLNIYMSNVYLFIIIIICIYIYIYI